MKRIAAVVTALGTALLGLAFLAPAAQAYPDLAPTVKVNQTTLMSGQMLVVRASYDSECLWTVSFAGETKTDTGVRTVERFRAPVVTEPTDFTLSVSCTYTTPTGGTSAVKVAETPVYTTTITVLPAKGQGAPPAQASGLPNAGGPNAWLLGGGLLLLAGGAGAVVVSRRRAAAN